MKRFLFALCLMAWSAQAQPILRNAVTTNVLANGTGFLTNNGTGALGFSTNITQDITINNLTVNTNLFFVSGKGNLLVVTQSLTMLAVGASKILKTDSSSNVVASSMTDNGTIVTATLPYRAPDGLGNAPAYSFSGDTDSGIYRRAAGEVTIVADGSGTSSKNAGVTAKGLTVYPIDNTDGTAGLLLTGSWNNASTASKGVQVNYTDTGSGSLASSTLLEAQYGGPTRWRVYRSGNMTLSGQTNEIADNGTALTYNGTAIGGSSGQTAGFVIDANQFIQANQTNIDNGTAGTNAFMIIGGSGSSTTNGWALTNAYAKAKLKTPHAAALAVGNRFTILLLPGVYNLGSGTLTLDTQFIDIVGISPNTGPPTAAAASANSTDLGDTIIKSSITPVTITVTPNDITLANLALETTTDTMAINWSGVKSSSQNKLINILLTKPSASGLMPFSGMIYAGLYVDVRSRVAGLFRGFATLGSTCSGTFIRCSGGSGSFGSTASGTFIDCQADSGFGNSVASGTFINCHEVLVDGGGGGILAGTFSGTARNCWSTVGLTYSSGTVQNCRFASVIENRGLNVKFSSGSADSSNSVVLVTDTATFWNDPGAMLATLKNAGTNTFTVSHNGGLTIGANTLTWTSGVPAENGETILSVRNVSLGEPNLNEILIGAQHSGSAVYGYFDAVQTTNSSSLEIKTDTGTDIARIIGEVSDGLAKLRFVSGGGQITALEPTVANGASAVAYNLDTANALSTAGAKLASFKNDGAEKAYIDKDGIVRSATGFILDTNTTSGVRLDLESGSLAVREGDDSAYAPLNTSLLTASAGIASTDTTAAVTIAATGWTNTFGKNATVFADGTTVTITVKNNAGTSVYTNALAHTGAIAIPLQVGGAVILSGTGVTGRAVPF